MLLSFRDKFKQSKWLGYTVVAVISVPFMLFGIGSYLTSSVEQNIAEVDGVEIPVAAYEQSYSQQRYRLSQAFGGKLPPALVNSDFIKNQAIETVIDQELLRKRSETAGYAVSDATLKDYILNSQAFIKDGVFDTDIYNRQLQSIGTTASAYEESLRQGLSVDQLQKGITETSFLTGQESAILNNLQAQERALTFLIYSKEKQLGLVVEPSDQEIESYFSEHKLNFTSPEQVKVEYLELSIDSIIPSVEVSNQELLNQYEDQEDSYATEEKRQAAHILLTVEDGASENEEQRVLGQITALRDKIISGSSFSEVSKEYSQDQGSAEQNGDLGIVTRGTMVPAFEKALYGLNEGELSAPVKTEFGYHLIKAIRIYSSKKKSFDEVKGQIEAQLKIDRAESIFFEKSEILANQSFENNDSIDPAADAVAINKLESGWLTRSSKNGIAKYPEVVSTAFSDEVLKERNNSQVIEIGDNHIAVLRVKEYQAKSQKKLEQARAEIIEILRNNNAQVALKSKLEKGMDLLRSGTRTAEVAELTSADLVNSGFVVRTDKTVDQTALNALFAMKKPALGQVNLKPVSLRNGDQALIVFSEIKMNESQTNSDAGPLSQQLTTQLGSDEFQAWFMHIKSNTDISRNMSILTTQ